MYYIPITFSSFENINLFQFIFIHNAVLKPFDVESLKIFFFCCKDLGIQYLLFNIFDQNNLIFIMHNFCSIGQYLEYLTSLTHYQTKKI